MILGTTLQNSADAIVVNVPLKLQKRGGRKEVILLGAQLAGNHRPPRPAHQEALVIAIARAYRWQKLLDDGKVESISDLAREIGLEPCFAARLMRLTLLAPDIVEAILVGEESCGLSLRMLLGLTSILWVEQTTVLNWDTR